MLNYNDTQNKAVVNNIIDELKLNPITDQIPRSVIPTIQPTFDVKKKFCNIVRSTTNTGSTATVYTTPSDKDFYLVSAGLSFTKANDAVGVDWVIRGFPENDAIRNFVSITSTTLTVDTENAFTQFNPPIKLMRNSIITIVPDNSTGTFRMSGNIAGYTEEAGNDKSV